MTEDNRLKKDKNILKKIFPIFNLYEKKNNKSDTLRKWIDTKIGEIVNHMNSNLEYVVYNYTNIGDFLVLYYNESYKTQSSALSKNRG